MKNTSAILAIVLIMGVAFVAGCQTAGEVVAVESSSFCPTCKTLTKTNLIRGLTYTKHVCQACDTAPDYSHAADGEFPEAEHTCSTCNTAIRNCEQCVKASEW